MGKQTAQPPGAGEAAREPLPDWVDETPTETSYRLIMWDPENGYWPQDIEMTRDEFLELKRHLAVIRGLIQEAIQ